MRALFRVGATLGDRDSRLTRSLDRLRARSQARYRRSARDRSFPLLAERDLPWATQTRGTAMTDSEVQRIIDKLQQLQALRRARERVRQLERELSGEPPRLEDRPHDDRAHIPEFLRQRVPLRVL